VFDLKIGHAFFRKYAVKKNYYFKKAKPIRRGQEFLFTKYYTVFVKSYFEE